jgi:hypothetical protein
MIEASRRTSQHACSFPPKTTSPSRLCLEALHDGKDFVSATDERRICASTNLVGRQKMTRSSRSSVVLVNEPAEDVAPTDPRVSDSFGRRSGVGWLKLKGPVRSCLVVVLGVDSEEAAQMAPAEDQDVVQALSSHGTDPALGHGVRLRGADGRLHYDEPFTPADLVEGAGELRVSITEQDVRLLEASGDREVPSLLDDPG